MLMNHKNFCFTQIPDITNDMIFLQSPTKTLFLAHFWPFLQDGDFFQKKIQLCHKQNYIWAPNTMLSSEKN